MENGKNLLLSLTHFLLDPSAEFSIMVKLFFEMKAYKEEVMTFGFSP
jgi:hypothetical protein